MYSTCLFCHAPLGTNSVERCPVGRRLAFDAARGRLWVVCTGCARWNLTPLEERWEAIEECERLFRQTRLRLSTENIGLARLAEGLELVRVGPALRPEFAAWRYGDRFGRRRRMALLYGGASAVALAAIGLGGAAAGAWMAVGGAGLAGAVARTGGLLSRRRIIARIPVADRMIVPLRGFHLDGSSFLPGAAGADWALHVPHESGESSLSGPLALRVLGLLLARRNAGGAGAGDVRRAVRQLEEAEDPARYVVQAARAALERARAARAPRRRSLVPVRPQALGARGALHLTKVEQLALEMAIHEETERRALEGELAALAAAWREAEEIAAIADDLLLPPAVIDFLRRYGRRHTARALERAPNASGAP